MSLCRRLLLGGIPLLALGLGAQAPAAAPRVSYSRSFKGSQPSFFEIEVSQDGQARYQGREQDGDPLITLHFTASPAALRTIFQDAAALDYFAGAPLESQDKVAYTGDKMLAYDDATRHGAQDFTYTKTPAAAALVGLFEKISATGMDAIRLERAIRYQPLDVLDCMHQIESDWSQHLLAEPQLLTPALEGAIANPAVMGAAQHQAQKLLEQMDKP